ncbi:MAG: signal peptide peptidase SppA [Micavibrio sp.]|nr:signal peptide peptidase SppA [Micavibrio sp.]
MKRYKWRKPRPLFSASVPKAVERPAIKWKVLPIVWLALKRGAMVLGFLVLFSMIISSITLGTMMNRAAAPLPDNMVLVLEFEGGLNEIRPPASLANPFGTKEMTLRHYVSAIERAKNDDRVKGIVARMRDGAFSSAQAEEIRAAILDFKQSGKFTRIYSTSFGGAGTGLGRYYLASAFDELWMQPMGLVMISGVNAEQPFARDALDKIGVTPQFFQRKEYKTAYESLTHTQMSAANREEISGLVEDMTAHIVSTIASDRGITEARLMELVNQGLFTADEALEAGLIDHMNYADVMIDQVKELLSSDGNGGDDVSFQSLQSYSDHVGVNIFEQGDVPKEIRQTRKAGGVALIYAVGAIVTSDVGAGGSLAASDEIAPAILDAAADRNIKAIVVRIDSPGGSPAASEAILRALDKAQQGGKPVIVSMGATAASGGYWIASHADQIFVAPTTITGSIGVLGGKFSLDGLWKKIGVNWDRVQWGENADMWSMNSTFDASGAARMNAMLDHVYANFIQRVAKGRKMSLEQVEAVAKGRVWSGKKAVDVGLADQFGGLMDAIDYAATLNGGKNRHDVYVQIFPKVKTPVEEFIALLEGEGDLSPFEGPGFQSAVFEPLKPLIEAAIVSRDSHGVSVYAPLRVK